MEQQTYITTEELAVRLRYDARYIRSFLKDAVFIEGVHFIRPFGRRRVLYTTENEIICAVDHIKSAYESLYG